MSESHLEPNERYWNIKETADYMSVSVAFLRKAVRVKRIPFVRVGSKALRFKKRDLDCWLEANSEAAR
jgi:excisionase family DNA binding protein